MLKLGKKINTFPTHRKARVITLSTRLDIAIKLKSHIYLSGIELLESSQNDLAVREGH